MTEPNEADPIPPIQPTPPVDLPTAAVVPVVDPPAPPVDPPADAGEPADRGAPAEPPEPPEPASPASPDPTTAPASDWREPPWFPPRDRDRRERKANLVAIVIGLIILAIGVYYFIDRTLGVKMPPIQWGALWPVLLIVIGGFVLLRSIQRR